MNSAWLGRLLRGVSAGERKLVWSDPALAGVPETLRLSSAAFAAEGPIPVRFAGRGVGDNVSPPLAWSGVLVAAAELVLLMEDPDAPLPTPFVHLIAYRIPPTFFGFEAGDLSSRRGATIFGRNTGGGSGYAGPRALRGHGPHRYHFSLYALDRPSGLAPGAALSAVRSTLRSHAIARGRLVGAFEQAAD
jgi:Raf kinase inhibitor-like YbhB/YbcL family protein